MFKIIFVIFVLVLVLILYSFVQFLKQRKLMVTEMVEKMEASVAAMDEEKFRSEAEKKDTETLRMEYERCMLETQKFVYPDNQDFVMEMAMQANIIKDILDQRSLAQS